MPVAAVCSGLRSQCGFFFFSSRRRHTRFDCDWSSDVCSSDLGEAFSRKLANDLARCGSSVWNMYGPTETTIWSSCTHIEHGSGPVLIGPPICETQIYVLDEDLQPVSIGMTGELYIGGGGGARGDTPRPGPTHQKNFSHPF